MPSANNRRSWRGVATSAEHSTLNYITESLRDLERSTSLMRQNVDNLIENSTEVNRDLDQIVIISNTETVSSVINADNLTQQVQQVLDRNLELKVKVEQVVQSNASFKEEIEKFLRESADWKQTYLEESTKICVDLEAIVIHRPEYFHSTVDSINPSVGSVGLDQSRKNWWNLAGIIGIGRDTLQKFKRKLDSMFQLENVLRVLGDLQLPNGPYFFNSML